MTQELKIMLGIGVTSILLLMGAVFFFSGDTPSSSQSPAKADPTVLVREDNHAIGSTSAQVTLVEFGDYQCPSCAAAHPVIKQITDEYKDKIRFVFRHFPLPQHKNALVAAEAAEAAGAQGKYWEMHDMIYENQDEWEDANDPLTESFIPYATSLELDTDKFKADVQANTFASKISRDQQDGTSLGVNATPTFFLNGTHMTGVPSYDTLKNDIDQLLK